MSNILNELQNPSARISNSEMIDIKKVKEEIFLIKKNFDQYHNKASVVKTAREFFIGTIDKYDCKDSHLKGHRNPNQVVEQYHLKHKNFDVALTIKTYTPASVISADVMNVKSIQQLNQFIEKAKPYFGQEFMIYIRNFCHSLITSAVDHKFDCYTEEGEFSFRFSVPTAKLNVELLLLN